MDKMLSRLLIEHLVFKPNNADHSPEQWEILLRQARAAGVLSRLAFFWKKFGFFQPPGYVVTHLNSADKFWLSQKRIVAWELNQLQSIFLQLEIPLILLKGSAYSAANLNAGLGRVFNDIDILVPKQSLEKVKEALKWNGWFPEELDSYNKRYYERWMHELPPFKHIQRSTTLDVHHNILPLTCKLAPNADLLLQSAINVPGTAYWVLAPEDMVLHSACHLFWNGEFENGLRDISDIDLLLREFSHKNNSFWKSLVERAVLLGLNEPLFYALRCSARILETPVPASVVEAAEGFDVGGLKSKVMDYLLIEALKLDHPSCSGLSTSLARWLLYVRSHWLKMPWYLLIPHLCRKAWMRLTGKETH